MEENEKYIKIAVLENEIEARLSGFHIDRAEYTARDKILS